MDPFIIPIVRAKDVKKLLRNDKFKKITSERIESREKIYLPIEKTKVDMDRSDIIFIDHKFIYVREQEGTYLNCQNNSCGRDLQEKHMGIPVKIERKPLMPVSILLRGHYCSFECVAGYLFYLSPITEHYTNLKYIWQLSYPEKELKMIPPQEATQILTAEELKVMERNHLVPIVGMKFQREYLVYRTERTVNA